MGILKRINGFDNNYSIYYLNVKKSTIEKFLFSDDLKFRHFKIKNFDDDIMIAINKVGDLLKNLLSEDSKLDLDLKNFLTNCHLKYNSMYQNNFNNIIFCENFYESYFRFFSILKRIDNEVFNYEIEDFEFFEIDNYKTDLDHIDLSNYWGEKLKY